eukprot:TRINITY_DN5479_c0_g1_i9.p2 TRINITY_DN5479_c0_g1~~TRINITY_DN5479_c0_g1_i9.p2  ORF type:complete len:145 (-),score=17.89 TRINITY_DN5479_c0_g1_i9:66-500(-)
MESRDWSSDVCSPVLFFFFFFFFFFFLVQKNLQKQVTTYFQPQQSNYIIKKQQKLTHFESNVINSKKPCTNQKRNFSINQNNYLTSTQQLYASTKKIKKKKKKKRTGEHTSELQSRDSISYAVFCLKKKKTHPQKKKKNGRTHV